MDAKNHGMNITCLEDDPDLQDKVLSVFHAVILTLSKDSLCENHGESNIGKGPLFEVPANRFPPIPVETQQIILPEQQGAPVPVLP